MTDQSATDGPAPMTKEETVKEDGRTLIYYTFPETQEVAPPVSPGQEATHV